MTADTGCQALSPLLESSQSGSWHIYYPFFIDEEAKVPTGGIVSSRMGRSFVGEGTIMAP